MVRRAGREFGRSPGAVAQAGQALSLPNGQKIVTLADITPNLGTVRAGQFEAGTGVLGTNFSGVILTSQGLHYADRYWSILGLNNETLQFGLDAVTGVALAGGGAVILDEDGVSILGGTEEVNRISWLFDGERLISIGAYEAASATRLYLRANSPNVSPDATSIGLIASEYYADGADTHDEYHADLDCADGLIVSLINVISGEATVENVLLIVNDDAILAERNVVLDETDLIVTRGAVDYTTAQFVQLATPLTSTAWDGDSKGAADSGVIDLSAAFGAPAGIKAAMVYVEVAAAAADRCAALRTTSGADDALKVTAQVAGISNSVCQLVPCDVNGDIYFSASADLSAVTIRIVGYCI